MKKLWLTLLLAGAVLASTGCGKTLDVKTDQAGDKLDEMKTYSWKVDELQANNPVLIQLGAQVQGLVNEKLENLGYELELTENAADFFVNYQILTEDVVDVKEINVYSGYGQGFMWRNSEGYVNDTYVSGKEYDINLTRKGTLLIDLVDSKTNLLLWRGSAVKSLENQLNNVERVKLLNEAIDQLFKHIPKAKI